MRLRSQTAFVLVAAITWSGCSPGMFFGDGRDEQVEGNPGYRPVNKACSGLKLGLNEIYVPQFRALVRCLNAYGGIDPIEKLTDRLTDAELQPLIDVTNRYLLRDRVRVREFDRTLHHLESRRQLDPVLAETGKFLKNGELVSSGIAILRNAYRSRDRLPLLHSLERMSTRMSPSQLEGYLEASLTAVTAPAFGALTDRLAPESLYGRTLWDLLQRSHRFIQESGDPGQFDLGRDFLATLVADRGRNLFTVLDETLGSSPNEIARKVPQAATVMRTTMRTEVAGGRVRNAPLFDDITSLVHYLNGPIECLQATKRVPNAMKWVLREIVQDPDVNPKAFIQRKQLLTAVAMNPFCRYPDALGEYYPSMIRLADTNAIDPSVDFLKAFMRQGLDGLLIRMLADTGSSGPGLPPENTARLKTMLPVFAEMTDRDVWVDALLLAASPRVEDRDAIIDEVAFLLEPSPALRGESIYDVMSRALARASVADLYRFALALRPNLGPEAEPLLAPALTVFRSAFHVNDAHPFSGMTRALLSEASQNQPFFDLLFRMTELEEFPEALRLLSAMALDGRMKDALLTTNSLIAGIGVDGPNPVRETEAPAFIPRRRHSLSAANLREVPLVERGNPRDRCRRLDTRVSMANYLGPRFDEQLENFVECIVSDGEHDDVRTAVDFLRENKTSGGRDYLEHAIDILNQFDLTRDEIGDLGDRVIRYYDELKLFRLMDALPLFVTRKVAVPGDSAIADGPVLRPLFDLVKPILSKANDAYVRLSDFGAGLVLHADLPEVLTYAERLWDRPVVVPPPVELPRGFDRDRLRREIRYRECRKDQSDQDRAIDRVIGDYNLSITNWDIVDGHGRREWKKHEWSAALTPMFQKFGDPSQNLPEKHAIDGLLGTLRLFTRHEGQAANSRQRYFPDDLVAFLHPRSDDYRAILYFPDGVCRKVKGSDGKWHRNPECYPRVKLVNTLDRMELIVLNADVDIPLPDAIRMILRRLGVDPGNIGLKFLALLAEAYGDDPREMWPDEIQRRHPVGGKTRPLTMAQAVNEMVKTARAMSRLGGFPDFPECLPVQDPPYDPSNPEDLRYTTQLVMPDLSGAPDWVVPEELQAKLFNIQQLLPVLHENLPLPHGEPSRAGGLRVMRDLLWELHSSSPHANRSERAIHKNNLKVATILSRVGFLRQTGRLVRMQSANDPGMIAYFRNFIDAAQVDELGDLFRTFFVHDREHRLVWKVVDALFDLNENAGDARNLKRLAFYGVTVTGQEFLGLPRDRWLVRQALRSIEAVARHHYDFLVERADLIRDVLKERRPVDLLQALYEDPQSERKTVLASFLVDALAEPANAVDLVELARVVQEDEKAKTSWDVFWKRFDALRELDPYQRLRLNEVARDLLHFFQEDGEQGRPRTSYAVRQFVAKILTAPRSGRGDLEEILALIAEKPDGFYQVLEMLGHSTENEELKDFVRLARRALSENAR